MTKFIQSLFQPILDLLDKMITSIGNIGTVAAKGIRLDDYFGVFNLIGSEFLVLIHSLLASIVFLLVLYNIKHFSRIILWLKALIKWW